MANANRNEEETPEPFTVNDFIAWLSAPFEDVNDADEEDDDEEADWEEDDPAEAEEAPDPEPAPDVEPAWMQWKRNIRAYAESVAPKPPVSTIAPNV